MYAYLEDIYESFKNKLDYIHKVLLIMIKFACGNSIVDGLLILITLQNLALIVLDKEEC